jgi:hypothetical protein
MKQSTPTGEHARRVWQGLRGGRGLRGPRSTRPYASTPVEVGCPRDQAPNKTRRVREDG